MHTADWAIIALIAAAAIAAAIWIWRGGGTCGGDCGSCGKCAGCRRGRRKRK